MPKFEKYIKTNKGELFEILNPNLITLIHNKLVEDSIKDLITSTVINSGFYPTSQDIENMRNSIKSQQGRNLSISIDESLLDFTRDIDIDVTGEGLQDNLDNKMNLVQMLSQNMQALADPTIRRLVDSALEDMGISYKVFNPYELSEKPQGGGQVSNQTVSANQLTQFNG